jgi:ribosomal protein L11 methyltransferase
VLALDYDPAAVQTTRANALVNGALLEARDFDLRCRQVPDADLAAANVLAGPLRAWAATQRRFPSRLILSGVLREEADGVSAAFAARGLRERDRRLGGDWAALSLSA